MPESRSAEWLQGAIETLETTACALETPATRAVVLEVRSRIKHYRQLLAAAEAREASPLPEVLEVAKKALDPFARAYRVSMEPFGLQIDQADGAQHWLPGGWPTVADCKTANDALTTLAAYRDGRDEAVRLLKQIIDNRVNDVGECGSDGYTHCFCSQCLAESAIAALRGGK